MNPEGQDAPADVSESDRVDPRVFQREWVNGLPFIFVETDETREALYRKGIPAISLEDTDYDDNPVDSFSYWGGFKDDGEALYFNWVEEDESDRDCVILSEKPRDHPELRRWYYRMRNCFRTVRLLKPNWGVFLSLERQAIRAAIQEGGDVVAIGVRAVMTATELRHAKLPPPAWIVDGVIPEVGLTLFVGRPKAGKSWVMIQLALGIAAGHRRALNRFSCQKGRVVYVTLEDLASETDKRIQRFGHTDDSANEVTDKVKLTWWLPGMDNAEAFRQRLDHLVDCDSEGTRPKLLILDPLLAIKGSLGNSDIVRREYEQMKLLRTFAERHQLSIILTHHTSKPSSASAWRSAIDSPNGTTGLAAAPDCVWLVTREPGDPKEGPKQGQFVITPRGAAEQHLDATLDVERGLGWRVNGTVEEVQQRKRAERKALNSGLRGKVLAVLEGGRMLTAAAISEEVEGNASSIRTTLSRLEEDGAIIKDAGSKKYLLPPKKEGGGGHGPDVNAPPTEG